MDGARIHSIVTEYETLDQKRMDCQARQKELLQSAEDDDGLDQKILKRLIRDLRKDAKLLEAEAKLLAEYKAAYSDFASTPLGAHAAANPPAGSPVN